MDLRLSERVDRVKPSPTMAVTAKAAELKRAGRDVIGLGAGEPDFDTPEHIKAAAIEAIRAGRTKYTAVDGIVELREAICEKFQRDNGIAYQPGHVLVSCGAKQSIYNLAVALLGPGDEAIVPAPYWVSYPDIVLLADATPVIVPAGPEQQFKITPQQLADSITPRTRLLILNSPSNPTGMAYSREELAALAEVLREHPQVLTATDDIYEPIFWGSEPFCTLLTAAPDLHERVVTINGVSKSYAMTGWRIGYAAGPAKLISAMKKIQGQSTSNPTSISQYAALAALTGDQSCIAEMTTAFRARHDWLLAALNAVPGFRCLPADGAFYAFPDVSEAISKLDGVSDDTQFAEYLLEKAGVAVVPGAAFGAPGHVRLSYACGLETLQKAVERIAGAL
ncbi:pyridoxal phosphate-dependent aminotransferase [Wenzhouxiangella sp. XN24]|uniref:aminotransferase class I/II-fold pyridoxal phosphate-dependent enzyme n=1 Tax=Wenzhouxiangella sp. XN24 TaxID=2713569 RepID=UPI0013EE13A5|nr:pyridoxal phosphate-dependent aminotransferase [Wenzhouxiangella sp. XN24]